jgi:hypothetical protein
MQRIPKILKVTFGNDLRRIALTATNFESLEQQIKELFTIEKGSFSIKYKDDEEDLISLCSNEEFNEAINCSKDNVLRLTIVEKKKEGGRRCGRFGKWRHLQQQQEGSQDQKQEEKQEKVEGEQQEGRCGRWNHHGHRHHHGRHQQHHHHQQQGQQFNLLEMIAPLAQQFIGNLGGLMNGEGIDSIAEKLLQGDLCKVVQNYVCDSCDTPISGTRFHCSNCEDFDFCSSCFEQKRSTHNPEHQFQEVSALSALKEALSRNDMFIDASFSSGKATDPEPKRRHNAYCDRCDQTIFGIRWKCFECPDFDLCNSCYLEANGNEDIKKHSKDHSFGKIEQPNQIYSFDSLKQQFDEKKREEILLKVQEQKKHEETNLSEIEKKRQFIQQKLEEERRKYSQIESQLEQERLELLQEEQIIVFAEQERKQKEEEEIERKQREEKEIEKERQEKENKEKEQKPILKIVYPFEQKLEALESMGFTDRERNIQLLVQHKGELLPVIQDLLI